MSDRAARIARIRKLLALSRSANEHEAASALEKARAAMAELGVDADDVALSEVDQHSATGSSANNPAQWEMRLALCIDRVFETTVIRDGYNKWTFIGVAPSAEIAAYAFSVLFRQLKAQRAEHIRTALRRCKIAMKRRRADLFCTGWVAAVESKVRALRPNPERALLVGRYVEQRYPDLVDLKGRAPQGKPSSAENRDYWDGHQAGRDANLRHGVGGGDEQLLIGGGA